MPHAGDGLKRRRHAKPVLHEIVTAQTARKDRRAYDDGSMCRQNYCSNLRCILLAQIAIVETIVPLPHVQPNKA